MMFLTRWKFLLLAYQVFLTYILFCECALVEESSKSNITSSHNNTSSNETDLKNNTEHAVNSTKPHINALKVNTKPPNVSFPDTPKRLETSTPKVSITSILGIEGGGAIQVTLADSKHTQEVKVKKEHSEKKDRIIARKGVNYSDTVDDSSQHPVECTSKKCVANLSVPLTQIPKNTTLKKKPLFTMITNDKEPMDSESFIESQTTGKDYVFPIVLCILVFPLLLIVIKLIYKRGTEFTERQQYHRMYLIDGMYNSR